MSDVIEFYKQGTSEVIARVKSSAVPDIGRLINIRREAWSVQRITYAIDRLDEGFDEPRMRVNVDLIRRPEMDP